MKFTFLGTGTSQGVPVIGCECEVCTSPNVLDQRLRTSLMVSQGSNNVVIDTGPDFRQQMLRAGVKQLDAVLFTHEHNDHVAGLDDIRPFNFRQGRDMPIFATHPVLLEIKRRFAYAFAETPYPGAPALLPVPISKSWPFHVGEILFKPIEVMHGQLPVLGFRVGDFAFITDMKTIATEEKAKLVGIHTLVINALHHTPHHSHMNLEEALHFIDEIKPTQAWLTHISHSMGLHETVSRQLPKGVGLAWDGMVLQF